MAVDSVHPEYKLMKDEWELVSACCRGQREVKALKTKALPAPGEVNGIYDADRYKAYLQRAIYTNIVGRTRNALVGAAFRKSPIVELSETLGYLEDNADGAGQSIVQISKDILGSLLEAGRSILLVDYPPVPEGMTAEQIALIQPLATIKKYSMLELINWKVETIGGQSKLVLAVLLERKNVSDDEFVSDMQDQYRVLRLRDIGYSQQLYAEGKPISEEIFPKMADSSVFDFIPLFIAGVQNNDPTVDDIPLADIAHVNIGHFRNSADMEESAFIAGQPMLHIDIGETDAQSWKELNGDKIELGSRRGIQTAKGKVELVQAEERNIYTSMMEAKEALMLSLGAKLVEKRNPNETATAAKIDATGENSVLSDIVANCEEAIQRCIEWCGLFMGDKSESTFTMNREFFPDNVDPAMIAQSIQLMDRGILAKTDVRTVARKANLISDDRTDEEVEAEAEEASPIDDPLARGE